MDGEASEGTLVSLFSHFYHSLPVYKREVIEMAHCLAGSFRGGGGSREALTGGSEATRGGDAGLVRHTSSLVSSERIFEMNE